MPTVPIMHPSSPLEVCQSVWSQLFPVHFFSPHHLLTVLVWGHDLEAGSTFGDIPVQHGATRVMVIPMEDPCRLDGDD